MDSRGKSHSSGRGLDSDYWTTLNQPRYNSAQSESPSSASSSTTPGSSFGGAAWSPNAGQRYNVQSAPNSPFATGASSGTFDDPLSGQALYRSRSHPTGPLRPFTPLSPATGTQSTSPSSSDAHQAYPQFRTATAFGAHSQPSATSSPSPASTSSWSRPLPPFNGKRQLPRHNPNAPILEEIDSETGQYTPALLSPSYIGLLLCILLSNDRRNADGCLRRYTGYPPTNYPPVAIRGVSPFMPTQPRRNPVTNRG
jgi:hypothetical protein